MKTNAYIGGYTREGGAGIYHLAWNAGHMEVTGQTPADNPSYLEVDGETLYAVFETRAGSIVSYRIGADGTLVQTGLQPSLGDAPCHVCAHGSHVFVANYSSGTIGVWERDAQGALTEPGQCIAHHGKGAHPTRQSAAHAHQCLVTPDGAYLAVCDLGTDCVLFYPRTERGIVVPAEKTVLPAGAGPRHAAFWGDERWAVAGELSCEIDVYQGYGASAQLIQRISALRPGDPESYCSALRLSPDGSRMLATTRGADTLTLLSVRPDGRLELVATVSTQGRWPRDAAFSPDGRFILCACEHDNRLTAFALEGDELRYLDALALPAPTCVCFTDEP